MADHDAIRRVIDNYLMTGKVLMGDVDAARAQLDALLARNVALEDALRKLTFTGTQAEVIEVAVLRQGSDRLAAENARLLARNTALEASAQEFVRLTVKAAQPAPKMDSSLPPSIVRNLEASGLKALLAEKPEEDQ